MKENLNEQVRDPTIPLPSSMKRKRQEFVIPHQFAIKLLFARNKSVKD
ncbi:hypothetical protein CEV31_1297 [Brucella thiophenivorans]|uniref:Uncharacterized protein n=1 Tax=Brucella thiophenivorans TaxID=571255 RepID=A0A256FYM7_9HYPH|nr:hypothetical protein CEV31_1297 [Brucella thiophenivorans]